MHEVFLESQKNGEYAIKIETEFSVRNFKKIMLMILETNLKNYR